MQVLELLQLAKGTSLEKVALNSEEIEIKLVAIANMELRLFEHIC